MTKPKNVVYIVHENAYNNDELRKTISGSVGAKEK